MHLLFIVWEPKCASFPYRLKSCYTHLYIKLQSHQKHTEYVPANVYSGFICLSTSSTDSIWENILYWGEYYSKCGSFLLVIRFIKQGSFDLLPCLLFVVCIYQFPSILAADVQGQFRHTCFIPRLCNISCNGVGGFIDSSHCLSLKWRLWLWLWLLQHKELHASDFYWHDYMSWQITYQVHGRVNTLGSQCTKIHYCSSQHRRWKRSIKSILMKL